MKKPNKRTSNRTCPNCGDRATKLYSLTRGLYECKSCNHEYEWDKKLKRNPISG